MNGKSLTTAVAIRSSQTYEASALVELYICMPLSIDTAFQPPTCDRNGQARQSKSITNDMDCSALSAGAFGVVAAVAGLQFLSDVPKVKKDIVEVRNTCTRLNEVLMVIRGYGSIHLQGPKNIFAKSTT